jgi:hypothetical protein
MLDILQGTPLWVYAVYLWICWYGIKATRGSRENHRSLMILPVVLVIWSLLSIEHSTLSIGCWLGGAAVGCLLAMAMFTAKGARLDGHTLVLPGTWKILLISQLFFGVKYYLGYQHAVHPLLSSTAPMLALAGGASGFTVGLFCGRAIKLQRALASFNRDEGIVLP